MVGLSKADHSVSPPAISIPRQYNAAHDLLERNIEAGRGCKIAYIDDRGEYTYAELAVRVKRLAGALLALGVQPEQRVLLCLEDTIDFPVAFLGCIYAGIIPVPVNTTLKQSDYAHLLTDSRASVLIVSSSLLPTLEPILEIAPRLRHTIVSPQGPQQLLSFDNLLGRTEAVTSPAPTTCDDPCFWLYSSGSTGPPKGTIHLQGSLIQTAQLYAAAILGLSSNDIILSAAKLFFAYGLGNALTFPLSVGATAILMSERPTPQAVFARLEKQRPTIFCGVPTLYASMLAAALPARETINLRACVSAGEALPKDIGERWSRHFGCDILDGIGSTEMLHIFISNRPDDVCYGTTGCVVPGYEVRLVDDAGGAVPPGEIGELLICGPSSASGYWNNRAKTLTTFQGTWTRSGDKYHQDANGHYIHAGRVDDMLKVSGLYVSPTEVESVLLTHPCVLEAAVIGVADGDGLTKPLACIVLHQPSDGCAALADQLKLHVKSRLAPHKYPRRVEFLPELPKTATGKIQRFKLRELYASRPISQ